MGPPSEPESRQLSAQSPDSLGLQHESSQTAERKEASAVKLNETKEKSSDEEKSEDQASESKDEQPEQNASLANYFVRTIPRVF